MSPQSRTSVGCPCAHLMTQLLTHAPTIGSTVAVKFIFLSFIGENVPMMKKAKTSTLKGTITEVC